jgi:hypothetical protein
MSHFQLLTKLEEIDSLNLGVASVPLSANSPTRTNIFPALWDILPYTFNQIKNQSPVLHA